MLVSDISDELFPVDRMPGVPEHRAQQELLLPGGLHGVPHGQPGARPPGGLQPPQHLPEPPLWTVQTDS